MTHWTLVQQTPGSVFAHKLSDLGVRPVRGFAVLLAYLVGVSAVVGIGIMGVMALSKSTPSAQPVAATSHKERLAKPIKQTTVAQKEAQPQKRKAAHVTRKRREETPTMDPSGFNAYGIRAS